MLKSFRKQKGQMMMENFTVIGIVVAALVVLTPLIRRGVQAIIKVAASQIGEQKKAEQTFYDDTGYLINSETKTSAARKTGMQEREGSAYTYDDTVTMQTNTLVDLGLTETDE